MAPPRTGSIESWKDSKGRTRYRARIHLADGSRPRYPVPDRCRTPKAREEWCTWRQEQEDRDGALLRAKLDKLAGKAAGVTETTEAKAETCGEWFARYMAHRRELDLSSVEDDRYRWRVWIGPRIDAKAIAKLTRDDVEDVRDAIDSAVLAYQREGKGRGRLAPKTGMNVWSVLTKAMTEACSSKRRDLRARTDNPCSGVQPPETGDSRRKTFVYPVEFLALTACEDVPLEWREIHAIACYTYLRPGELKALRWTDIDLKQGIVSVTKAWDGRKKNPLTGKKGVVGTPKTRNGVRDVPIPPTLLPLLKRMREGKPDEALVVPLLSRVNEDTLADLTRAHLKAADVTRARLSEDTKTTMGVNFRSWRDSGITWLALDGVDVAKMQRRAGHDSITTTLGYVKMAEDVFGIVGTPFPELPEKLVSGGDEPTDEATGEGVISHPSVFIGDSSCEGRELNPYRSYPAGT